jgi:hypothetical protein
MKRTIALIATVPCLFSVCLQAASVDKVTLDLAGFYQGPPTTTLRTNAGVVTFASTKVARPFRITSADILATYGKTPREAFLVATRMTNETDVPKIQIISGTNEPITIMTFQPSADAFTSTGISKSGMK